MAPLSAPGAAHLLRGCSGGGWGGRYLDTLPGASGDELLAVCVGQTVPLHLVGSVARAAGLPTYLSEATLDARYRSRVTILTFSEFGRRPEENEAGTDHGSSRVNFLIGANVRGGIHGTPPGLARAALDRHENPVPTVDFRTVYADVLRDWLQIDPYPILGGQYPSLGLIAQPPGTGGTTPPPPPGPRTHRTRRPRARTS